MKTYFTVLQSVYKKDNPIFLSQSLQSIANNTVQPVCLVLVKDGALTPELESVISEWQSKLPLKAVGYEKNQGLAYALNYGLQFVETELVARMDSDDICFSARFEKQIAHFNGMTKNDIIPLMRLAARFLPGCLNKKAYLSQKRQKLFKENLMNIKSLNNQVFIKNGHIFEAVIQFEENGIQMIKAVQLDSKSKCIVEVPASEVELFRTSESVDVSLEVKG